MNKNITVGPGVKMAIIWIAIATSFGAGWYTKGKVVSGELANSALSTLKSDIEVKSENTDLRNKDTNMLVEARKGRNYDKDCANMSISDFIK